MSETDKAVDANEVVETNQGETAEDKAQGAPTAAPPDEGPLFQRAPVTAAEIEQGKPIELSPDAVGQLSEEEWYAQAYRGGAAQLTVRAIAMGSGLGFLLAFTNLYVGLKTGWHLGVSITAAILSFTIWGAFVRVGIAKTHMTILENNCMASTASAAGYATGGTMVSAIPALLMLSITPERPEGTHLPWAVLAAWTFFLALLGTVLAIPMKRNMINQERLRFPTGTAAATTLKSLYSEGVATATKQAITVATAPSIAGAVRAQPITAVEAAGAKGRALMTAAAISSFIPLLKDLDLLKLNAFKGLAASLGAVDAAGKLTRTALVPGQTPIFDWLPTVTAGGKAKAWSSWNVVLDHGVALVAAGALVGVRITLSMIAGGLILIAVLAPMGLFESWVNPLGQSVLAVTAPGKAWKEIGLWFGAPMLVSSGILNFALQWKTIVRAFQGFGKAARDGGSHGDVEVPMHWFTVGGTVATIGIVGIAWKFFDVPPHLGILAVFLTFVLALVACRATGETDITPTGAMGKIMQLIYGGLIPQSATANLMTAGITAGASSASADLLTDLKSGYLLGANPRRQFIAQLLGIVPGTIATTIGFFILVPRAQVLVGDNPAFPAPAAQQWKAVAEIFKVGIGNLHPFARETIVVGIVVGIVLVLAERLLPKYKKYLPSATGVGLGFILPFYYCLAMFLGAVVGAVVAKQGKKYDDMIIPVASGLIAGESIIGVIVQALNNFVLN
ncbi:MAG: OPT/YSL family transporter [Polyangiaceae bacterium]|nr:OPT/YSL family transporter [Polyangiaceae bacterium]